MADRQAQASGIGLPGVLAVVFVTLKLTNYIDWSWWWVLSPLWIQLALVVVVFLVAAIVVGLGQVLRG